METNKFDKAFEAFACAGDTIEADVKGFRIVARIEHDADSRIDDDDVHNTDQSVTGCTDEEFAKLLSAREAWKRDEWFYCGVVLSIWIDDHELDHYGASLWAIECNYPGGDNSYLTEVANELLEECIGSGRFRLDGIVEASARVQA